MRIAACFLAWLALSGAACVTEPSGTGGQGGSPTSSSNSSGSNSSSSGIACTATDVSACPKPTSDCAVATCSASGVCDETPVAARTACTIGPGASGLCDGNGACVTCLESADCPKDAMGHEQFCETTAGSPKLNTCVACDGEVGCPGGVYPHCEQAFNAFEDTCVECRQSAGAFPAANPDCATNIWGHACLVGTDTCGCTPAGEATACGGGLPPHCASSDLNVGHCVDCDVSAHCTNSDAGHKCGPAQYMPNVCGCDVNADCAGIPGKPICVTHGVNLATCRECNTNAECINNPNGKTCTPMGGTDSVCGCGLQNNSECGGAKPTCNLQTHTCM